MNATSPFAVVVNDDRIQLAVLSAFTRKAGLEPLPFTGAEDALAAMVESARGGSLPALVVTDIHMPGIDGWRFCRLLRSPEYAALNHIPILVVSATFAGDEPDRISTDLGADAFLAAPTDGRHFVAKVRAILSGERPRPTVRVLIVEDGPLQAADLQRAFTANGYQADVAISAGAAAEAFGKNAYDIAVLDNLLPDGTGTALLESFRALRPDCVCVMMTASPKPGQAIDWMKRGAAACLQKPFEPPYLIELCARARRERALLRLQDLLDLRTRELQESEARFSQLIAQSPMSIQLLDSAGKCLLVNRAFEDLWGLPFAQIQDLPLLDDDRFKDAIVRAGLQRAFAGETADIPAMDYRPIAGPFAGRARVVQGVAYPIKDKSGAVLQVALIHQDTTERAQAEAENAKLIAQLHHAQKMESIGRLAGGVAHDFGNMLQSTMNYLALCRDELAPAHPALGYIEEMNNNARRSADLVRQLLAFACKQAIAPRLIPLNDIVTDTLKMLRQILSENVALAWTPHRNSLTVMMDPQQVAEILVSLAANAQNAITDGGKLSIETQAVTLDADFCSEHEGSAPGPYALLRVSDNGCGMDQESLKLLFEPFFSTRDIGKGTGLGLASVYGIVKQNGGFIEASSDLGVGTDFWIYLPQATPAAIAADASTGERPGGAETILLVEDEASIRVTAQRVLRKLGYTVLIADSAEEACRQAAEHAGAIHLILTDVVLPDQSGWALAAQLAARHPGTKLLFMSGHAADTIGQRGALEQDVDFLAKPFSRDDLARKVRETLDR